MRISNVAAPLVTLTMALCMTACSSRTQFAKAAGPLAQNFAADINASPGASGTLKTKADAMATAATAGDKVTVVSTWFGEGGVREGYVTYLSADPRFATTDGAVLRDIKHRKVDQFDYVLSIGTPPPPPPSR